MVYVLAGSFGRLFFSLLASQIAPEGDGIVSLEDSLCCGLALGCTLSHQLYTRKISRKFSLFFSCVVLFSFFKENPGKIFQGDLCANKLSSSKQASSLPWVQSPCCVLRLLFLAYVCSAGREIYPHKESSLLQGIILLLETYNEMIIPFCLVSPGDQGYVIMQ